MSTLDHLTSGRVGWNIVTGYLDSAARGMGLAAQPDHDSRYDAADEYMSVVYQLWEASWEDGAVLRDKSNRIFADPAKIHRVRASGPTLPGRCNSPGRAVAAADAGAVSGRLFDPRPRVRCDACRMRLRLRGRQAQHPRNRRRHPWARCGKRARPARHPDFLQPRCRRRPHATRGRGEVSGISQTRQRRGRAGAFLKLYRSRLLTLRAGRADPLREE